MTPAVVAAQRAGIAHRVIAYEHDPDSDSYGEEAARLTGQPADRVFKTLVVTLDGKRLAVAVVPVDRRLDLKAMAASQNAKKAAMADAADAERATGYVVGGISPLGQKRRLPVTVHSSALERPLVYVSAARRRLELELRAADLIELCKARLADIVR